jgi:hypothetical protein
MQKLIQRFRANPTVENAKRLLTYNYNHPFASLLLSQEDQAVIEDALDTFQRTKLEAV